MGIPCIKTNVMAYMFGDFKPTLSIFVTLWTKLLKKEYNFNPWVDKNKNMCSKYGFVIILMVTY